MSDFHHSYLYRSTETEKKGRKINCRHEEICKCLPPFVKLHYHDCPVVSKRCPIHGNIFSHSETTQKIEREQNVIISFHPSSKTERLLQPIKSLLAHCNSETKINFQYYSPGNSTSKESLKVQTGQKTFENIKRTFNNNIFVEKTKSFVTGKSNKVKKLKQCFHSPCNSVAQKTRSQTSVKEKMNQILREEAKQTRNAFYNVIPEVPPNDAKEDPTSKWFYSNLRGFRNYGRSSDENMNSDFVTVTQYDNSNAINHKIFEIKHRKGLNEIPFVGFAKQPTQLVYSAVNVEGGSINQARESTLRDKQGSADPKRKKGSKGSEKNVLYGSEKSQGSGSESSGSLYITPFFFLPKGMDDSDSDSKLKSKKDAYEQMEQGIQVDDLETPKPVESPKHMPNKVSFAIQTSPIISSKTSEVEKTGALNMCSIAIQTSHILSEKISSVEKPESVLLQTESTNQERISRTRRFYGHDREAMSETVVREIYFGNKEVITRSDLDEHSSSQNKRSDLMEEKVVMGQSTSYPLQEGLIAADWDSSKKDQTSQTEEFRKFHVSVKAFDSKIDKSQNTMEYVANGCTQTSFYDITPEESVITEPISPNVTFLIKSFDEKESDPTLDNIAKAWWGKSHSDSDLFDKVKCCCCKGENENAFLQCDISKNSPTISAEEKRTFTKVYESNAIPAVGSYPKGGSVTLKTKETIECFPDSKQTSTKEEEFCASVSDLSELKRIIQEFFEKRNFSPKKTCECQNKIITEAKENAPIPKQEVQKLVNAGVQTKSLPVQEVKEVQTHSLPVKEVKEVQTNVRLLLCEKEQLREGQQRVKFQRTVVVDDKDQIKVYFICALCGRDLQNSVEATTNTEANAGKRDMSTIVDTECIQMHKIQFCSKSSQSSTSPEALNSYPKQMEPKGKEKNSPNTSPHASNSKKTHIPISVRFANERNMMQRECSDIFSTWSKEQVENIHNDYPLVKKPRECECDQYVNKSTDKSRHPNSIPKQDTKVIQHRSMESQNAQRAKQPGRTKSYRNDILYPLIFTPFWPRYFTKTWKSMENSIHGNPSDNDTKSQSLKQKRSYEKEKGLGGTGAGKKIKVDCEEFQKEYSSRKTPPSVYENGKPGDFIIWPNQGLMSYRPKTPDQESSHSSSNESNKEQTPEKLLDRETSPENEEEFLEGECAGFSDNEDSIRTSEISLVEEDDPQDEEVEGDAKQEILQPQLEIFSMSPKLKLQSLSAVTFDRSFYSDMTTSKSLNEFLLLREAKKNIKKISKKQTK